MKINPKELQQIIKEEAIRLKRKMTLESEKESILKKLQEMESCDTEIEEAFLGIMGADEKDRKQKIEQQIDAFLASGAIGNKTTILDKAKEDNHGGTLTVQMAGGQNPKFAGKKIIIYTPKPTTMQKLAAGTSTLTGGGGAGQKNVPY